MTNELPIETNQPLSLCPSCNCMTKTIDGACGKCGADKAPGEWEKRYSKIMLEWIESQWKIEKAHQDGYPYTRMQFEADANKVDQKLKAFIADERERVAKAYGGCEKCYGKGYFTELTSQTASADFPDQKSHRTTISNANPCSCERGKQFALEMERVRRETIDGVMGLLVDEEYPITDPDSIDYGKMLASPKNEWNEDLRQRLEQMKEGK